MTKPKKVECVHEWRPATIWGYWLTTPVVKCIRCGKAVRCRVPAK
jgi:hypothetical protein